MAEAQNTTKWAHSYTFNTFKGSKPFYIPKQGLHTWEDLLFQLEDHTNFQCHFIELVINRQRVFYDPSTKLSDIGIRKTDHCIVLKRRALNQDTQRDTYEEKVKIRKEFCMRRLRDSLNDQETVRLTSFIESRKEFRTLFQQLTWEFDKLETMVAIELCEGRMPETKEILISGQAASTVQKRQFQAEKQYLKEFLGSRQTKKLTGFLQKTNMDEMGLRGVVRAISDADQRFRQYEPRHKQLVKKYLCGLTYLDSDGDSQDDSEDNTLSKEMFQMVKTIEDARKPSTLNDQIKKQFTAKYLSLGFEVQEVQLALAQASNDVAKGQEVVKGGAMKNIEKFSHFVKRNSRINIILQFFAHPQFQKIIGSMKGKRKMADKFVEWVVKMYQNNLTLTNMIGRYKDHVVTFISGEYIIEKSQKYEHPELSFCEPSTTQQQSKTVGEIEEGCNQKVLLALKKVGVDSRLAEKAVRASGGQVSALRQYLKCRGVNQHFDFCAEDPQAEQILLFRRLRRERDLLVNLRGQQYKRRWLLQLSVLRPWMFGMVVRNRQFFDRLVSVSGAIKK